MGCQLPPAIIPFSLFSLYFTLAKEKRKDKYLYEGFESDFKNFSSNILAMDCNIMSCTNSRLFDFIYCHPVAVLLIVAGLYLFWVVIFVPIVSICPTESECSDISEKTSEDRDYCPLLLRSTPKPEDQQPNLADSPKRFLMESRTDSGGVNKEISFLDLTSWRTERGRGCTMGRRPVFL